MALNELQNTMRRSVRLHQNLYSLRKGSHNVIQQVPRYSLLIVLLILFLGIYYYMVTDGKKKDSKLEKMNSALITCKQSPPFK